MKCTHDDFHFCFATLLQFLSFSFIILDPSFVCYMSLKVIGVGQGRTGTASTQLALNILGFKSYHMKEVMGNQSRGDLQSWTTLAKQKRAKKDVDLQLLQQIYEKGGYDATVDAPGCWFWQELHRLHPNGKFVLNVRDGEKWVESVTNTIYMSHEIGEGSVGKLFMSFHRFFNTFFFRQYVMTNAAFWQDFLGVDDS